MATEQAGFRPDRGTIKQIFSFRLLAENYLGMQDGVLYHVFIDFKKPSTKFGMKACGEYYIIVVFNQNYLTLCKTYTIIPKVQSLWEGAILNGLSKQLVLDKDVYYLKISSTFI